ncbi:MAG: YpmS family protein [Carnobacterium jeotgali]|uniref:YpmS family protein n=2 Tax=Carnobacterium jeotgali TaxID=545534 RepID=UPI003C72D275
MSIKSNEQKSKLNGWKWAFLVLLSIVLGTLFWFFTQMTPVIIGEPNLETQTSRDEVTFQVSTKKDDINQLVASYLKDEKIVKGPVNYQFKLEDQAQLVGTFQLFGKDVQFQLSLEPFVMENGNLQFKTTGLSIGKLNLPISFALNQIESQLNIPDWVAIDSEQETLVFNLNEFTLDSGIHFSVDKIDLAENDIRINVYVPTN